MGKSIQEEINSMMDLPIMQRSDAQLDGQIKLSALYKDRFKGTQPASLEQYNDPEFRKCKLNRIQAEEIRSKYIPGEYGKKRLAAEYGVSKSVITRILNNQSWKQK